MFLKSLKIENGDSIIREIPFLMGINLIVDETNTDSKKESGNSVGKTTVLRLIDFCLGGDGKNIYSDTEFKDRTNQTIESFLKENRVVVELVLKEDLQDKQSREIVIRRNFLARSEKFQEINGEPYNNKEFPKKLKELIFHSLEDKPTFRQIIAKNIRDEKNRLVNSVKVLHSTTTQEEYEALYYFWLGVDLKSADRKQRLLANRKIEENLQTKLRKETNLSQIEQSLLVIERSITDWTRQKETLNLNENFENDLSNLNEIKSEISSVSTYLSRLEFRKSLIEESKQDLESQSSHVSVESVRKIYAEAKALIPDIQKSFEDTLDFHNAMVKNKIKYITQDFPELIQEISDLRNRVNLLLSKENALTKKLQSSKTVADLEKIIVELNKLYERKGNLSEQKRLWESSIEKIDKIDKELDQINAGIKSHDILINERIAEFNKYFSDISNRLYGEQFVLSLDNNKKGYELVISSALSGNLGTGKKKGQIAAFDLSYIQFADANDIPCLHFILHDQIENIHDNQISSLLTEIVSSVNCQYILPVLRDKLPSDIDVKEHEVLSLSQGNKLFRV